MSVTRSEAKKAADRAYYLKNREAILARVKTYQEQNPAVNEAAVKRYQAARADRVVESSRRYRANNPDRRFKTQRNYRRANPDKVAAAAARRRARLLKSTPKWADQDAISAVYGDAAVASILTGELHEVDHIVPLKGKNVCGLHVQNNLRVTTKKANRSKGNKLINSLATE